MLEHFRVDRDRKYLNDVYYGIVYIRICEYIFEHIFDGIYLIAYIGTYFCYILIAFYFSLYTSFYILPVYTSFYILITIYYHSYTPFVLPPAISRDIRGYVQGYFRSTYGVEVSVRPVHRKWLSTDEKPYIAVNAQVQTGDYVWREWTKQEVKKQEGSGVVKMYIPERI
jgi:hypothetical protein